VRLKQQSQLQLIRGSLNEAINAFVIFFPIYNSMLRIAKGEEPIFHELISKLKFGDTILPDDEDEADDKNMISAEETVDILSRSVDEKNIVRAGIRWQVFERDNFKCVACGLSASDGAILHIDHIIPRSKGGKDNMDNYQTLCHKCNIGKSNKSQANLRMN